MKFCISSSSLISSPFCQLTGESANLVEWICQEKRTEFIRSKAITKRYITLWLFNVPQIPRSHTDKDKDIELPSSCISAIQPNLNVDP